MEDLLASIRKAINDDIGDMPAPARISPPQPLAPSSRVSDELAAAANEIQQLRDKISRARAGKPLPPAEPAQRAASLAAALRAEAPRRNWRDLEPGRAPVPEPRLRGTIVENEPPPAATRTEPAPAARVLARSETQAMLSGSSAQAVHSAFNKLADTVLTRATSDRALEDMTRDMLRVMLKQWLDENLPAMVERMVREEIERVARTGR